MESKTKKIELEILTPMFSHGADTGTPEFRIPELKAAMRFWWRALNSFESFNDMKVQEGRLFGDSIKNATPIKIKYASKNQPESHRHTLFTRVKYNKKTEKKEFEAISPKNTIILELVPSLNCGSDVLEIYQDLIYITAILGGLGQRARRGKGAIKVHSKNFDNKEFLEILNKNSRDKFEQSSSTEDNESITIRKIEEGKLNYPYIEEINIGQKKFEKYEDIQRLIDNGIRDVTENTKASYTNKNGRFASPVYISIFNDGKYFRPSITILKNTQLTDENKLNYDNYKKIIINNILKKEG